MIEILSTIRSNKPLFLELEHISVAGKDANQSGFWEVLNNIYFSYPTFKYFNCNVVFHNEMIRF